MNQDARSFFFLATFSSRILAASGPPYLEPAMRAAIVLLLVSAGLVLGDPPKAKEADEELLRKEKIDVSDANLLDFFRKRTISEADRTQIAALIKKLDDDDFETREKAEKALLTLGRKALASLEKAAESPEQEVRLRAERCVKQIGADVSVEAQRAALRIVAARCPAGVTEVLLAYLIDAPEPMQGEVIAALGAVAARDEAASKTIAAAAGDAQPLRRKAVATILLRTGRDADRAMVRKQLGDEDPGVRFHVAEALLRVGDAAAVPTLIALVEDGSETVAADADEMLQSVASAGPGADRFDLSRKDGRRACRERWEGWWQLNRNKVDLSAWAKGPGLLGRTIICELADPDGQSRVWECAANGKTRWKIPMRNPVDVQSLPEGRVLVADCIHEGQVVEFDRHSRVLWSFRVASPVSVQRLPSGNTFIATQTNLMEVTRAGRVVHSHRLMKDIHWGRVLPDGNYVYLHSKGFMAILSPAGKQLKYMGLSDVTTWGSFEILPDGRLLVCQHDGNRVVEMDWDGKVQWDVDVRSPNCAVRIPGGKTLISSGRDHRVIEVDREGKTVWSTRTEGRPFAVVRR
jgi:hypothetical protein